jgi:glycosyltransferase involved in cell wall biosynthesis
MPKICIVGPSKKFLSGISVYTIRLANALSESNNVSVLMMRNLLPKYFYPGKKHVGIENDSLNPIPDIRTHDGMDWNSPLSWMKAYRFLQKEKPDVIIMQWWTSSVAHMELFLALTNRIKIQSSLILEMHELVDPLEASKPIIRSYSRLMSKLILSKVDSVVVHSASIKQQIIITYHLKDEKVFVIPHGVYDIYPYRHTQESARLLLGITEPFVILYFGMIRKYKGVPYLIDAFNRLPESVARNSRLIIAGEDWGDEKGLKSTIDMSPYKQQISFIPEFIPDNIVPKYFTAVDVVVLPYLRTSGSGVTSLAIAYGKPIIISDLEHTRESLKEYEGAIFVPCGDSSGIASKLSELYTRKKSGYVITYGVPPDKKWGHINSEYEKIIVKITK